MCIRDRFASVRLLNSFFQDSAWSTLVVDPSGSISMLPSGCPAIWRLLKSALSNSSDSISWIEESYCPYGLFAPPAIKSALLIAGGANKPYGQYDSSIQLIESELFDKADFNNLHIAGHPEGSMDIDPDGSTTNVDQALSWKNEFSKRTDANLSLIHISEPTRPT